MKWYIDYFTYKINNKIVKEYFISDNVNGGIVAGDFRSYHAAKNYITKTLTKSNQPAR